MDRTDLQPEAITHRLDIARSIALQAGEVTLQHFQTRQISVERKSDDSPVTIADREVEHLLRRKRQKPKELNFVGIPLWNLKSVSGDLIKSASILPKNITLSVMSLSETL